MNRNKQLLFLGIAFVFFTSSLVLNSLFLQREEEKMLRQQREEKIHDSIQKIIKTRMLYDQD
jgi:hypothetical protein